MSWKRVFYVLVVVLVAGISALSGAVAGGVAVYQAIRQNQPISLAEPAQTVQAIPASAQEQALIVNTIEIQTTITQAVQNVRSAVVTVVGTVPGQQTFFGPTGDQTVSGSGVFISEDGYILTNNHVVEGCPGSLGCPLRRQHAASDHRWNGSVCRPGRAQDRWPGAGCCRPGQLGCAEPRRNGHRHRLAPGRFQEHGHGRRDQRHRALHRHRARLPDRGADPDRCRHQPGQLWRSAGEPGRAR